MAVLDVTQKAGVYETLSSLNTAFAGIVQHLQKLQRIGTFKPKSAKLLSGLHKSCKPKSTKTFWKTCIRLNLMTGTASAKSERRGTRNYATPTMFSFRRKNVKSNSPNNARKSNFTTSLTDPPSGGFCFSPFRLIGLFLPCRFANGFCPFSFPFLNAESMLRSVASGLGAGDQ